MGAILERPMPDKKNSASALFEWGPAVGKIIRENTKRDKEWWYQSTIQDKWIIIT